MAKKTPATTKTVNIGVRTKSKPRKMAPDAMEKRIVGMALRGELAGAARSAIRRAKSKGIAVTFQRGELIIKQHPDGTEEILGRVAQPSYELPKGVRVVGRG